MGKPQIVKCTEPAGDGCKACAVVPRGGVAADPWGEPIQPTPEELAAYRERLVAYRAMKPGTRGAEAHELLSGCHYAWLLWLVGPGVRP
jgi:hypothetical protein